MPATSQRTVPEDVQTEAPNSPFSRLSWWFIFVGLVFGALWPAHFVLNRSSLPDQPRESNWDVVLLASQQVTAATNNWGLLAFSGFVFGAGAIIIQLVDPGKLSHVQRRTAASIVNGTVFTLQCAACAAWFGVPALVATLNAEGTLARLLPDFLPVAMLTGVAFMAPRWSELPALEQLQEQRFSARLAKLLEHEKQWARCYDTAIPKPLPTLLGLLAPTLIGTTIVVGCIAIYAALNGLPPLAPSAYIVLALFSLLSVWAIGTIVLMIKVLRLPVSARPIAVIFGTSTAAIFALSCAVLLLEVSPWVVLILLGTMAPAALVALFPPWSVLRFANRFAHSAVLADRDRYKTALGRIQHQRDEDELRRQRQQDGDDANRPFLRLELGRPRRRRSR